MFLKKVRLAAVLGAGLLAGTFRAQAVTYDPNVPAATQSQVSADLNFMSTLVGSKVTPLHTKVFGSMTAGNYPTWFDRRVKSVAYDENDSSGAVAYVAPFNDPSQMVLTKNYIQFDHPQIARMMVVFHEARHTESEHGNWPHATCPNPFLDESGQEVKSIWTGLPLAGEDGCDDQAIGAYGSSVVLLKNVNLNCESCNEKVKMDAGLYAEDQMKRIIDPQAHGILKQDLYGH